MYGGATSYLPLRVNQAGVIPIIFAQLPRTMVEHAQAVQHGTLNPQSQVILEMGFGNLFGSGNYRIDQGDMTVLYQISTIDTGRQLSGQIARQHLYQRRVLLNLLLQLVIGQT